MNCKFEPIPGTDEFICPCCKTKIPSGFSADKIINCCPEPCTKEPRNFIYKISRYLKEYARHVLNGKPESTERQIIDRFKICQGCEEYIPQQINSGQCAECGCVINLLPASKGKNKLAWADEECPLGKWSSLK